MIFFAISRDWLCFKFRCYRSTLLAFYVKNTVWKFRNFSTIQILREWCRSFKGMRIWRFSCHKFCVNWFTEIFFNDFRSSKGAFFVKSNTHWHYTRLMHKKDFLRRRNNWRKILSTFGSMKLWKFTLTDFWKNFVKAPFY